MIACICKRIRPESIDKAIDDGASTIAEVGRDCGAGTGCGGCHDYIQRKIDAAYDGGDSINSINFLPVRAAAG